MSFQTGLSGLNASSRSLDVIGNNIANANTVGMKSSRAEFSDLVAASLGAGGGGGAGLGVAVANIAQQFTQGSISITGNGMDVAINGSGFFQEQMPDSTFAYTRAGDFKINADGFIVTNSGGKITGYPTDTDGNTLSREPQVLQLPTGGQIPAQQTGQGVDINGNPIGITIEMNLPASVDPATPSPAAPSFVPAISTYGTSMTAYDAQGVAIPVSLYFVKTANDTWSMFDSTTATAPLGTVTFDSSGANPTFADSTGTPLVPPQLPTINITSPNPNIGTFTSPLNLSKATQFGSNFAISNLTQDGYASGELTGVTISPDGAIRASYSNGKTQINGQIALANFRNTQGLSPAGGNNWVESYASGQPVFGTAGEGKFGALQSGALEDSNVDLTAELVNMMTAQRAYQANAQTIKTQDQVMSTLVNLR